jgi:CheY-like chemotaxis protein/anti-sigma regulatory factor (Ser/Thr protein kinase)
MAKILVVEDNAVDRLLVGKLLAKGMNLTTAYADNGRAALDAMGRDIPDLVLTDMQMPEMDGLQLVREARQRFPLVPVILVTAHGSEELAVQALRSGAASYVPKQKLAGELVKTIESVLSLADSHCRRQHLRQRLTRMESHFALENDRALIPPLVAELTENLTFMGLCDETESLRVTVALGEALDNAMIHGNLEISSDERDRDEKSYHQLIAQRREQTPWSNRLVYVTAKESRTEAIYVIRDEGPGFDRSRQPDPHDPHNLEQMTNRGLLLIQSFMDEVSHNAKGNEITLVKRRGQSPS